MGKVGTTESENAFTAAGLTGLNQVCLVCFITPLLDSLADMYSYSFYTLSILSGGGRL